MNSCFRIVANDGQRGTRCFTGTVPARDRPTVRGLEADMLVTHSDAPACGAQIA
jgi:hypothetical protein